MTGICSQRNVKKKKLLVQSHISAKVPLILIHVTYLLLSLHTLPSTPKVACFLGFFAFSAHIAA